MLLAYFDTNAFSHFFKKKGITESQEGSLRAAIESGRLNVLAGLHAIDETAANPEDPLPELRLIWELCDWERIVKPAEVMLTDDTRHFAYSGEASHPFIDASVRADLQQGIQELLCDFSKLDKLRGMVTSIRPQQKQFRLNIQQLKRETNDSFLARMERKQIRSFDQYFEKESGLVAGWLAEHVGFKEECQARTASEFLKIRSILMAVGLTLSYIWGVNVEGAEVKPSDGRDFQHAISAASARADFFVTDDEGLTTLAERVPIKNFRPLTLTQLANEFSQTDKDARVASL